MSGSLNHQNLLQLCLNLTESLPNQDRFERLLATVRQAILCDAVVLLKYHPQGVLRPLAQAGLTPDILGRQFKLEDHPRLRLICEANAPTRFPAHSELPDPYDSMLLASEGKLPIHACMGLPLVTRDELIGVLTLDSLNAGAFDEIPQRTLDLISAMAAATLQTATLLQQLEQRNRLDQALLREMNQEAIQKDGGQLIGDSEAIKTLKKNIELVAATDFKVLIEGETGVGKELVARHVHQLSTRNHRPLVYVNCAAIPENLIESELFGHRKGAFTGAHQTRNGKFLLADGGTLFLDEIGELPLTAQSKLLRVLQNQEIQPLGQDTVQQVDVRIIAATNRDLKAAVLKGEFREDLYHRLSVYPIHMPPLRQRHGDINLLAGYFTENTRRRMGLKQLTLSPEALSALSRYTWPGNVRELEHVISRAALIASSATPSLISRIEPKHLGLNPNQTTTTIPTIAEASLDIQPQPSLKEATEAFQRQLIIKALSQHNNNWAAAARTLDIDRANLVRLSKRLGIH